ncbi:acetolactate synthase-1/2/3 large subunit [Pusillimonas noertemannii]|uniref:Acetolactate synthase-1/2/3 large subunit n=2 Tax=Pusillimonas noertemannii TaxID=305977 RepID=A0A2U1CL14_9BURK|nr:thiamine pyrophosphate-requiring protein [Pusillimonas noertemannii]PVY61685.1 acetolactate synthase-1/2/3 large subunit [Pusillimonas noertemannii]TFL09625.1 thiamine pyrophosphate-requiring protein [Pusillimonas noertemannii]
MNTQSPTASHYFLEALMELGVEYLFCNLGTDHAPIIEEMARWKKAGLRHPEVILCPHENTAVHMAAGYAVATGQGQAVLVHVDSGTANSAMGLHNLFRTRIPVLLMAGRAPFSTYGELPGCRDTYVHFIQEPFDQAGVVRPYVKWEYTLQSPAVVKEVLARAHTVMQSDPMGPSYLMLPREILAATHDADQVRPVDLKRNPPSKAGGADAETIRQIAQRLLTAENPLLVTAYAGRNPETPGLIDELAQFAGIRVCEFNPVYLNIRRDSPCFAGYQPDPYVKDVDVGLLVDVDVPWIPKYTQENPDTWWAQLDVDTSKRDIPMWSFPTQLRVEGDSFKLLSQLLEELRRTATPEFLERAKRRLAGLAEQHAQQAAADKELAADPGAEGQINPHYLCAVLGKLLDADDIVLNEAVRNVLPVFKQIPRTKGGTLMGMSGGGLSYSGGTALGMKLARPDRNIVQIIGDGTFYFSNPSSVYAVARQFDLPILTVVLDNSGWSAVKQATLRMYPDGEANQQDQFSAILAPDTDMAKLAESAGAYGEVLADPADAEAAIQRCLAAVKGGQAAILQVRVSKL